jgi:hypothetical protein
VLFVEEAIYQGRGRLLTRMPEVVPFVAVEIVEAETKVRFLAGAESEAYCSTQAGFFRIRQR